MRILFLTWYGFLTIDYMDELSWKELLYTYLTPAGNHHNTTHSPLHDY
ncbi:MAG: hypothetical protein QXY36_00900 [Sulfolobales archaeon]